MTFNDPDYNPYDPTSPDYNPETKPLDEILRMAIQEALMNFRVHLPGKIITIRGNQRVDVQPLIQVRYMDGTLTNMPPIQNLMVQMFQGQNYSIKLPISVDDTGSILFSDRSLDIWSNGNGGIVDPQDSRMHDLQDAVFIPGLVPFSQQTTDKTSDLVVTSGQAQFRMTQAGGFKIQNIGAEQELINILTLLVQTLSTASTVLGGPFTPDVVSTLTQMVANLKTLQG